jgi:hypothetical protein
VHLALSERGAEFIKAACEDQINEVGDEDGIYAAVIADINEQVKLQRQNRQDRASKAKRKARKQ